MRGYWKEDLNGGDKETRTPDPLLAKQMLYQLSYIPFIYDKYIYTKKIKFNFNNCQQTYETKFFRKIKCKTKQF